MRNNNNKKTHLTIVNPLFSKLAQNLHLTQTRSCVRSRLSSSNVFISGPLCRRCGFGDLYPLSSQSSVREQLHRCKAEALLVFTRECRAFLANRVLPWENIVIKVLRKLTSSTQVVPKCLFFPCGEIANTSSSVGNVHDSYSTEALQCKYALNPLGQRSRLATFSVKRLWLVGIYCIY